jgi:ankyrin repeat protein
MEPLMSPGTIEIDHKQKINGNLYYALMKGNKNRVAELCQKIQDHALHVITVNDDTVLHMATYAKEASLVEKLLDELPDHHLDKLTRQNRVGNTILHETATSNHTVAIADKLLKRAPGLLGMRNHNGETALFRAARYGKTDMFNFLAAKVSGYDESGLQFYVQRSDKTTILHMAILSLHFGKHCQL